MPEVNPVQFPHTAGDREWAKKTGGPTDHRVITRGNGVAWNRHADGSWVDEVGIRVLPGGPAANDLNALPRHKGPLPRKEVFFHNGEGRHFPPVR